MRSPQHGSESPNPSIPPVRFGNRSLPTHMTILDSEGYISARMRRPESEGDHHTPHVPQLSEPDPHNASNTSIQSEPGPMQGGTETPKYLAQAEFLKNELIRSTRECNHYKTLSSNQAAELIRNRKNNAYEVRLLQRVVRGLQTGNTKSANATVETAQQLSKAIVERDTMTNKACKLDAEMFELKEVLSDVIADRNQVALQYNTVARLVETMYHSGKHTDSAHWQEQVRAILDNPRQSEYLRPNPLKREQLKTTTGELIDIPCAREFTVDVSIDSTAPAAKLSIISSTAITIQPRERTCADIATSEHTICSSRPHARPGSLSIVLSGPISCEPEFEVTARQYVRASIGNVLTSMSF